MRENQEDAVFREGRFQHERLRVLADSINETARMARTTLSFLLLVALYLAFTLLSSTDENLLLEGQVVLPQVGTGISVVLSYILAPLVFVCMHAQVLLILSVLARKMRTFEDAVEETHSNVTPNRPYGQTQKREYRDWLSAFAFVQIFQKDVGVSNVARGLTWLATGVIPLALLFLIDLSFLRYQSSGITWLHHIIFLCDLALVIVFNWVVFGQRAVKLPRRLGTWVKGFVAAAMVLLLLLAAHPPGIDEKPKSIWSREQPFRFNALLLTVLGFNNLLDVGPCRIWRIGCRYLDVGSLEVKKGQIFSFAGRTLRFARFASAQLQRANFSQARLQGA